MKLRDYQQRAVDRVMAALRRRPILVAPTGSGKTVMATALVERLGRPTWWLAHRKELIEQAADRLVAHGLHVGIIMAGFAAAPLAQVQVASVQTLVRRDLNQQPTPELIIIDECHHASAQSYGRVLDAHRDAAVVGLTATPFRLDGRGLGDLFGELVVAAHTDELCEAGVLYAPKVWASREPNLQGLKVIAGDYRVTELARRTNTDALNADIVATWQQRAAGRRTVAFAVDVGHSRAIAEAFNAAGVPAEHLDGRTSRAAREAMLERLAAGRTLVLCNCMVLTEGWDLPALECAVIARPTASLNLHLQMIGRVMRACEGKAAASVLDHAGNHHAHGMVTRRLNYSLDGRATVAGSEPLNLKRCGACALLFAPELDRCPDCGWLPAPQIHRRQPLKIHGHGELVEFDDSDFAYRQQVWREIEAMREAMGYQPGWSLFRFEERFGERPLVVDGELVDAATASAQQKRKHYEHLLAIARERDYADGWASHRFREVFGHWPRGFVKEVRSGLGLERVRRRLAEAVA